MTAQDKIWKCIRSLREFTLREVSTLSGVPLRNILTYTSALARADYINRAGLRKEHPGRHKLWRLIKNTGPKTPKLRRCLLDPNINTLTEVKDCVRVD
jgi:hypothetical protein